MRYTLEIEVADNKSSFAEEFFKSISFVKKVRAIVPNEIANESFTKSKASPQVKQKVVRLSDSEKEAINIGLKSIRLGKTVTHESVKASTRKKFPALFN